ncbi:NUDIX domain-containing protein [Arthrobacter gengyunqii]|uniref:NUDIX domain-containing protein n=1 Tax=Arthrobacter gengyunqii TaxID=2886940 RepID=A0A9X1M2A3_9MICC|nr:NUDIX domain-containing protein [Arthrobacter gengyunqii]MCC3270033.1 NUDIX domain-containing protein [Arthrobacter gengyunqii]UOY95048.1 NUDIX domain-containing protein [Arthrobacter gengyunqii]
MPLENLLISLRALPESGPRDEYLRFLNETGDAALRRAGGPEHVTGSCFVFSPGFDRVLLCFHRKGQFWVQFGGHLEPQDATVAEAAQREAREESGIDDLTLLSTVPPSVSASETSSAPSPVLMDLDLHRLNAGFSCSAHWDVGYAAVVSPDAAVSVSDESEDVRWFPVDNLPAQVPAGFGARLEHVRRRAMSLQHRNTEACRGRGSR